MKDQITPLSQQLSASATLLDALATALKHDPASASSEKARGRYRHLLAQGIKARAERDAMTTLETRITAAINGGDLTPDQLAALLSEAQTALAEAERAAEVEAKRALDPLVSPDPVKARRVMEDTAFARDRLKALLPRLRAKHSRVAAERIPDLGRELRAAHRPACGRIRAVDDGLFAIRGKARRGVDHGARGRP